MTCEHCKEILERVIRTETRVVQLGDHVGANLRVKQRIEIIESSAGVAIQIDSFDVSLSRIYTELHNYQFKNGPPVSPIPVYMNHRHVMTVYP